MRKEIKLFLMILIFIPAMSGCLSSNQKDQDLPEKIEFHTISKRDENSLEIDFIPKSDLSSNYVISYNITEDGEKLYEKKIEMENISSSNPIEISIDNVGFSEYEIDYKIVDEYNRVVYENTIKFGRENTVNFSFEQNMQGWDPKGADLDNPPVEWRIKRSKNISTDGNTSIKFYLENVNDAGKIWIERSFYVKPNTDYEINVTYDLASLDWGDFNLWRIITNVAPDHGKKYLRFQGDTGIGNKTDEFRWEKKSYQFRVKSSSEGEIYAMIGVWGTWETTRVYYIDNVEISFKKK